MTKHDIKIISKLNRDTKEGTIKWEVNRTKPSSLLGSEVLTDNVYTCQVLDKKLRLYRYQSKSFYDEELWEWVERYRLEFIDNWGNAEWAFPEDRGIYDLYETVRYKAANIENFRENYLTDEEKKEKDTDDPFGFQGHHDDF